MNKEPRPYTLFEALGLEIELMIVDSQTMDVMPIADELIHSFTGEWLNEFESGEVSWCNEIVTHLIEMKTTTVASSPAEPLPFFKREIKSVNERLKGYEACLMPGGAHPWMNPAAETSLWQHENREIYSRYDEIFDCRRHGWANLQSVHLNLPFRDDEDFGRLHAACRVLLPIIQALAASTPILDMRHSGFLDGRMEVYRTNSDRIASMTGDLIPERVFTEEAYREKIFRPLFAELAPIDQDRILSGEWANARGAIARFDRGSIEIRTIDAQESILANLAVSSAVYHAAQSLTVGPLADFKRQSEWEVVSLLAIHEETVRRGGDAVISDREYISLFGLKERKITAMELWMAVIEGLKGDFAIEEPLINPLNFITGKGCLASRILKVSGMNPQKGLMREIAAEMCRCLAEDRMFGG